MSGAGHLHASLGVPTLHSGVLVPSASSTLTSRISLYPGPLFTFPDSITSDSGRKIVNTPIFFMSFTGHPTSFTFNFQLIIDVALVDYTKITGIDLSKTPFATAIQQSNSPEAIFQLLLE